MDKILSFPALLVYFSALFSYIHKDTDRCAYILPAVSFNTYEADTQLAYISRKGMDLLVISTLH